MIEGSIWKTDSKTYNLQLKFKNSSEFKQLDQFLQDWRQIATGFSKAGDILNIFRKEYTDPKLWFNFAKTLPIILTDDNGKPIKTAVIQKKQRKTRKDAKTPIKTAKQSGRTCGKCSKTGHNSRTCKG
jgi:hypothetical protein